MTTPRDMLEQLCSERGENYASLSRLLGRNDAYIQQYLRKGTPRQLNERERRILARHFRIPESLLGGLGDDEAATYGELVPILRMPDEATDQGGRSTDGTTVRPAIAFDRHWLQDVASSRPSDLSILRIAGDSMAPTLNVGDEVLFDRADGPAGLRDGVYVLRVGQSLLVRRLAVHPVGKMLTIQSDNPAYADAPACNPDEIDCVGRVIWVGRRVA